MPTTWALLQGQEYTAVNLKLTILVELTSGRGSKKSKKQDKQAVRVQCVESGLRVVGSNCSSQAVKGSEFHFRKIILVVG